jgi:hypothetical protein
MVERVYIACIKRKLNVYLRYPFGSFDTLVTCIGITSWHLQQSINHFKSTHSSDFFPTKHEL